MGYDSFRLKIKFPGVKPILLGCKTFMSRQRKGSYASSTFMLFARKSLGFIRRNYFEMKAGSLGIGFLLLATFVSLAIVSPAFADVFSSTSYKIDASVSGSFGGQTTSTSYKMTSSGGESIIGDGAGGSYKMGQGYVAQLDKSLQLSILPKGSLASFPFDENTAIRVYDSTTYGNDANATGTPSWVTGKLGNALSFNGSSQNVSFGNPAHYQITSGTAEAWVKSSVTTGRQAIINKESNYYMLLNANKLAMYDANTSTTCSEPTTGIADGQWHHVAMTFQSGVTNGSFLYKDGVQVQTCTMTTVANTSVLQVARSAGGEWLNGSLDEVRLFSRVLTAAEVKAEYNAQSTGSSTGLSLNTITPGASQVAEFDTIVLTDAPGYDLSINQDHDLQFGANTIAPVSGTIGTPVSWTESSTKGFGFTLYGTNATAIPGKWGSGGSYAAVPGASTSFYSRTGYTGGGKDVLNMRFRSDVATSQPSGFYTNMVTITGTMTP